jgi:hypothetical protein
MTNPIDIEGLKGEAVHALSFEINDPHNTSETVRVTKLAVGVVLEALAASEARSEQAAALLRMALIPANASIWEPLVKAALDFASNDEEALAEGRALTPTQEALDHG